MDWWTSEASPCRLVYTVIEQTIGPSAIPRGAAKQPRSGPIVRVGAQFREVA